MRSSILLLTVFTLVAKPLPADQIHLTTGEMLSGEILRMNNDEISIRLTGGGIVSFQADQVSRVRKAYKEPPWDASTLGAVPEEAKAVEQSDAGGLVESPSSDFAPRKPASETGLLALPLRPPPTSEGLVKDPDHRFAVVPPENFTLWSDGVSPTVPISYREPITHSSFTVSTYASKDSVREITKNSLRAYTANFKTFTILRNEKIKRDGKESLPETWLVEIVSRVGGVTIQQLQVFTKNNDNAYILTYSAAGDTYTRHRKFFEKSIETFHFLAPSERKDVEDTAAEKSKPGR